VYHSLYIYGNFKNPKADWLRPASVPEGSLNHNNKIKNVVKLLAITILFQKLS
jgi:hypothetical protein